MAVPATRGWRRGDLPDRGGGGGGGGGGVSEGSFDG